MTTANSSVKVGNVTFSSSARFALIAGPCQMETRDHAFDMAGRLKEITDKLDIGLVYKSSFDKANRKVTIECWPFLADVTKPNTQFPGWPRT